MATDISSSDALLLLRKWKEERSFLDVMCFGNSGDLHIYLKQILITELSEDTAGFSADKINFTFLFREASFKYLKPGEIPPSIFGKDGMKCKSCLKSFDNQKAVYLIELDIDTEHSA